MKITPIAQSSAALGMDIGAVSAGQVHQREVPKLIMKSNYSPDRPISAVPTETPLTDPAALPSNETQTAAEEERPLSPQFAALAKQRRAAQEERRRLEIDRKAFEDAKAQSQGGIDVARLKTDPLAVLAETGILDDANFYNALTDRLTNGQVGLPTAERKALEARIESLEKGIDEKLTSRDELAEKQAISEMRREASSLVQRFPDQFKYAKAMGSTQKAVDLIHQIYKKEGTVLDVSEALNLIESEAKKDYERIQKYITTQEQAQAPPPQGNQRQQPQGITTLTNRDDARPILSRRERAIQAAYGQLKK